MVTVSTLVTGEMSTRTDAVTPTFDDTAAKVKLAVDQEVERRLRLGLPVVVDEGHGIEDLSARPKP